MVAWALQRAGHSARSQEAPEMQASWPFRALQVHKYATCQAHGVLSDSVGSLPASLPCTGRLTWSVLWPSGHREDPPDRPLEGLPPCVHHIFSYTRRKEAASGGGEEPCRQRERPRPGELGAAGEQKGDCCGLSVTRKKYGSDSK